MKKFYKFLDKVGAALLGLFFATFIVWFIAANLYCLWDTGLLQEVILPTLGLVGGFVLLFNFIGEAALPLAAIILFIVSGM